MHFFSFFDVLLSAPSATGMTLMLLMFLVLLISLFSFWYLPIFSFSFLLTLMSPGIAISIMHNFSRSIHYSNIWFPCLDLYHIGLNIPQNLHLFIFNNIFWNMFIPFFTSFQVAFPTQFPRNYSCNIIVPSLALLLCQLFTFAHNMSYCFTFLVTHSTKWWFGLFIYLVFHIVCSNCLFLRSTQHGFFQLSSQLFSASSMLLFRLLFLAFLLQTAHAFFCFSIDPFPSSNSV